MSEPFVVAIVVLLASAVIWNSQRVVTKVDDNHKAFTDYCVTNTREIAELKTALIGPDGRNGMRSEVKQIRDRLDTQAERDHTRLAKEAVFRLETKKRLDLLEDSAPTVRRMRRSDDE